MRYLSLYEISYVCFSFIPIHFEHDSRTKREEQEGKQVKWEFVTAPLPSTNLI
jgi:hypothetical protein